jgi:two-component system KDP operon response regulator KdpE
VTGPRILMVVDDPKLQRLLRACLRAAGMEVVTTGHGREIDLLMDSHCPDLIVLEPMPPDRGGWEMLREIRAASDVPVLIVSAAGDDAAKVQALALGADDYLPKPFHPGELVARIHAVLRRAFPETARVRNGRIVNGAVVIDLAHCTVQVDGRPVSLTPVEWRLLQALAMHPGVVMSHAELLTRVFGRVYWDDVTLLRVAVQRLRRKLEPNPTIPRLIQTVLGVGYRLADAVPDDVSERARLRLPNGTSAAGVLSG